MKKPLALIVDDQELDRQILSYALKKLDVDCVITTTAQEFLEKMKTLKPDICFIDLQYHGVEMGFQLVRSIRSVLGSKPALFIVSGVTEKSAIAHAVEMGANDYLTKPLNMTVLASKLSRYVHTDRLEDFEAEFLDIDEERKAAELYIDLEVAEIDEFGVKLEGVHLLTKGTVIRLQSEFMTEVTSKPDGALVTVSQTWVDEANTRTGAYAEFDLLDTELLKSVRQWLAQNCPR